MALWGKLAKRYTFTEQERADLGNIQLGSAYLKQLLDRNNSHLVLATASYNAGPHRVQRWLPEFV